MWRFALAASPVLVLALALAGGVASQTGTPTPTPESSPSASPSPSPSPEASSTPEVLPPPPQETPPPSNPSIPQPAGPPPAALDPAYPGSLRPGDWVQITNTDSCLNMRWEPRIPVPLPDGTTHNNVVNCLPDGFIGRLDASAWSATTIPVLAEGRWWWHIVGQGWAAEEWLTLHHQGGIPWPERPDLAHVGLIAYLRSDGSIWLMSADGTGARQLVANEPNNWIYAVQWSPDGDRLAFAVSRGDGGTLTRVVNTNGTLLAEFAGLSEPRWSPGGGHLSGVRNGLAAINGYNAVPVVLDLGTGAEWALGPPTPGYQAPMWSPDGTSLAIVCSSGYIQQPDGTIGIDEGRDCRGDGLRIVSADGATARLVLPTDPQNSYLYAPSWSPSGGTIAVMSMQQGGCVGYALVDVASGTTTHCVTPPGMGALVGGGCGGPTMSGPSWTADGRLVFSAPGSGRSGVFVHDLVTGAQSFIPGMSTGQVSSASDGMNLTYASGGHIWVASSDGSNLTLLAEGHSPAWQPLP